LETRRVSCLSTPDASANTERPDARATFETSVNRISQKPENISKTKPLYSFFHKFESEYGELSQIIKMERRMADLFPEDAKLTQFASRYSSDGFDPTAVRPIISPATQMRPKVAQSIEMQAPPQDSPRPLYKAENSPRPQYRMEASPRPTILPPSIDSPKRPFGEDLEAEANRPRKLARGESPLTSLKGAAGRRLAQQKQTQSATGWQSTEAPFIIPREINFLLGIIPRAETYQTARFNPEAMVRLLARIEIPDYAAYKGS
jgi:cleavage stimulation factor subunit 3